MTTKTRVIFTLAIVALLFASYIVNSYRNYYITMQKTSSSANHTERIKTLGKAQTFIHYLIIVLTLIGFTEYVLTETSQGMDVFTKSLFEPYKNCS